MDGIALGSVGGDSPALKWGLFAFLTFFFSIWNSIMSFSFVAPTWVTFLRHPNCKNLSLALCVMLCPHVLVGLIMPTVVGGVLLFFTTAWPYFLGCWRINARASAESSSRVSTVRAGGSVAASTSSTSAAPAAQHIPVVEATVVGVSEPNNHTNNESNETAKVVEAQSVIVVAEEKKELF